MKNHYKNIDEFMDALEEELGRRADEKKLKKLQKENDVAKKQSKIQEKEEESSV